MHTYPLVEGRSSYEKKILPLVFPSLLPFPCPGSSSLSLTFLRTFRATNSTRSIIKLLHRLIQTLFHVSYSAPLHKTHPRSSPLHRLFSTVTRALPPPPSLGIACSTTPAPESTVSPYWARCSIQYGQS